MTDNFFPQHYKPRAGTDRAGRSYTAADARCVLGKPMECRNCNLPFCYAYDDAVPVTHDILMTERWI